MAVVQHTKPGPSGQAGVLQYGPRTSNNSCSLCPQQHGPVRSYVTQWVNNTQLFSLLCLAH